MLSLVLKGKIGISEDVLTAAFFGAFRMFPDAEVFGRVLALARPSGDGASIPVFDAYEIDLWPAHRAGEPDARVLLRRGDELVMRLLVEAKLGAEKSGAGAVSADCTQGDQLARYMLAEAEDHPQAEVALVYVTHHASVPRADLAESAGRLRETANPGLGDRLFWISWRDVEALVGALPRRPPWKDLQRVFRKVAMHRFKGMHVVRLIPAEGRWSYAAIARRRAYPRPEAALGPSSMRWTYAAQAAERVYRWAGVASVHSPLGAWTYAGSARARSYVAWKAPGPPPSEWSYLRWAAQRIYSWARVTLSAKQAFYTRERT